MESSQPASQFRVTLPDGYVIERLPLGYAHDAWHLVFIGWPSRPYTREETRTRNFSPLSHGIIIEAVGGNISDRQSGGHGSNPEEQQHYRIAVEGASALRVSYRAPSEIVASEEISLGSNP